MKRRDLLLTGGAFLSTVAVGKLAAQPAQPVNRAAIIIGVDHVDGMSTLHASNDAIEIADWLKGEDFAVKLFTDREGAKIHRSTIFDAVDKLIGHGPLEMLVVYFAGHGYLSGPSRECWMLSGAPRDPGDAVSVTESATFAKFSGVPNVVFISDACRTLPQTFDAGGVSGNSIMPNKTAAQASDVDKFFACLPGWPANEASIDDGLKRQGLFTKTFLTAFRKPRADMVLELPDGLRVVPNEKLKKYLKEEVTRRAQEIQLTLKQTPDAEITSEDNIYIGKAAHLPAYLPELNAKTASVQHFVDRSLSKTGFEFRLETGVSEAADPDVTSDPLGTSDDFATQFKEVSVKPVPQPVAAETGISVNGASIFAAFSDANAEVIVHNPGFVEVALNGQRGATVGVEFVAGNGGIVAALDGYIANLIVIDGTVKSVTYVPSQNSWRWFDAAEQQRLDQLHATVATAFGYGVFRIEGDRGTRLRQAEQLADDLRVIKSIDPTLSIYTSYAYFDADLPEYISGIASLMWADLGMNVFDVAMLNQMLSGQNGGDVYPVCPMLSRGWDLMRPLGPDLLKTLVAAVPGASVTISLLETLRPELRGGLWTTLSDAGMQQIKAALGRG